MLARFTCAGLLCLPLPLMAVDVNAPWDYGKPEAPYLERRWNEVGAVDRHVFVELELLYRATGDEMLAAKYSALAKAQAK